MNAHTPASHHTVRIETITVTRQELADCFAEWARRALARRPGFVLSTACPYVDDDAFEDADRLIRLACEHAVGMVPPARAKFGRAPLSFDASAAEMPPREPEPYGGPHTAIDPTGQPVPAAALSGPLHPALTPLQAQLFIRLSRLGEGGSFIPLGEDQARAAQGLVDLQLAALDEDDHEALRLTTAGWAHAEVLGL